MGDDINDDDDIKERVKRLNSSFDGIHGMVSPELILPSDPSDEDDEIDDMLPPPISTQKSNISIRSLKSNKSNKSNKSYKSKLKYRNKFIGNKKNSNDDLEDDKLPPQSTRVLFNRSKSNTKNDVALLTKHNVDHYEFEQETTNENTEEMENVVILNYDSSPEMKMSDAMDSDMEDVAMPISSQYFNKSKRKS